MDRITLWADTDRSRGCPCFAQIDMCFFGYFMIPPESFRLIHNDLQIVKVCLYETDAGFLVTE